MDVLVLVVVHVPLHVLCLALQGYTSLCHGGSRPSVCCLLLACANGSPKVLVLVPVPLINDAGRSVRATK